MAQEQILVVEDESVVALNIRNRLRRDGYNVPTVATTGEEAIRKASELKPDLVLMDIVLKNDLDGVDAAAAIRREMDIPIIYLTAHADKDTVQRAKLTEPYGYILKPFQAKELYTAIELALHKHRHDRRLRRANHKLSSTIHNMGEAVITTNTDGEVTYMNPAAESLTGWRNPEAVGRGLPEIFRIIDQQTRRVMDNPVLRALREGSLVRLERQALLVQRNGGELPIDDSAAHILDENGDTDGVVLAFHDASAKVENEKLQLEWRDAAEKAERLKKTSLSNLNQEIREPLHIILGYTNLVEEHFGKDIDARYRQYFTNIREASRRLLEILKKIVDLSRFHVNEFPIRPRIITIDDIIKECLETHADDARKKKLTFKSEINTDKATIFADPYAIRSALSYVLDNAIKFTKEGAIEVIASKVDDDRLSITIRDTGVGITRDYLPHIFDEFSRFPDQGNSTTEGVGLGLALTKRFVEHSNGSITVKSRPESGTTFAFSFPITKQEPTATTGTAALPARLPTVEQPPHQAPGTEKVAVLVVEDDRITQRLIQKKLGPTFTVYLADSADQARVVLRDHSVDVILMDIYLNGSENGLQLTQALKERPETAIIPVIVITAHTLEKDRRQAYNAGCDVYLTKPFNLTELEATIHSLVRSGRR